MTLEQDIIEKAYQNVKLLGNIGKNIIASLSAEQITETVYQNINNLMDVDIFGIAVFNEKEQILEIRNGKEEGITLPFFYYEISEINYLAVNSFINNKEIIIDNYQLEYKKYSENMPMTKIGKNPVSVIYIPLAFNDKKIGAITIQSFKVKAYNENHLYMLRNIAVYTSIALTHAEAYRAIEEQRVVLDRKNKETKESILYAKKIQDALLPSRIELQKELNDFFVLLKPRDLVSGDFYWFANTSGKQYTKQSILKDENLTVHKKSVIAVVDCTGHGVPGAFLCLIGINLLNQIVLQKGITSPDKILKHLHSSLRRMLKQKNNSNRDGMDAVILTIDTSLNQVEFSGANRPLFYVKNNEIQEVKGNILSVGGFVRDMDRVYDKVTLTIDTDTSLYLSTDGFVDQFGGEQLRKRKFMTKKFKELLLSVQGLAMDEQKNVIEEAYQNWKGDHFQIDDILILGIKLSAN